jgi:hypothetical protein
MGISCHPKITDGCTLIVEGYINKHRIETFLDIDPPSPLSTVGSYRDLNSHAQTIFKIADKQVQFR